MLRDLKKATQCRQRKWHPLFRSYGGFAEEVNTRRENVKLHGAGKIAARGGSEITQKVRAVFSEQLTTEEIKSKFHLRNSVRKVTTRQESTY